MKSRFMLLLLLANAAALAVGFLYFSDRREAAETVARQAAGADVDAWRARALDPANVRVVYRTNAFDWSQVETADYRQYIANLRAIGCPEITIKDIVLTDLMRLYAQRRGQLYDNGRPFRYWETDDKRRLKASQAEARDRQLAAIDKELPAVLRELLGVNYEREVNKYFVDTDEDDRRLSFLSDDKRDAAMALRERFEGERENVLFNVTNGAPSAEEAAQLRQIDQDQEAALAGMLTADEKAQYDMSMSPVADHLRAQLVGFNPTEQEFSDLYTRMQAADATFAYQDTNDPAVQSAKAQAEQQVMDAFKAGLDPARAAALAQSQDPDYQSLYSLSAQYDLPDGTSQAILDMRQAAQDERKQLLALNIPADRMQAALQAIQAETERAARETLGDQAYAQYAQQAAWIQKLGRMP